MKKWFSDEHNAKYGESRPATRKISYGRQPDHYASYSLKRGGKKIYVVLITVLLIVGVMALYSYVPSFKVDAQNLFSEISNFSRGLSANNQPQYNITKLTVCLNSLYSPGTPIRFWTINASLAQGYVNDCNSMDYRNVPENASSESYLCHLVYRCENYSVETTTAIPIVTQQNSTYSSSVPSGNGELSEAQLAAIFGPGEYNTTITDPNPIMGSQLAPFNITTATLLSYSNSTGSLQELLLDPSNNQGYNVYGQIDNQIQSMGINTCQPTYAYIEGAQTLHMCFGGVTPEVFAYYSGQGYDSIYFGRKSTYVFMLACKGSFDNRCWRFAVQYLADNI